MPTAAKEALHRDEMNHSSYACFWYSYTLSVCVCVCVLCVCVCERGVYASGPEFSGLGLEPHRLC